MDGAKEVFVVVYDEDYGIVEEGKRGGRRRKRNWYSFAMQCIYIWLCVVVDFVGGIHPNTSSKKDVYNGKIIITTGSMRSDDFQTRAS